MTTPGTAVAVANPAPTPMTFPQKLAYAAELAEADLLPSQFRRKPASVLWAVEYAEALGLRGVVAIAAIHVIEGKPAPSAAMAAGLIRAKGHRLRVEMTPVTDAHPWGTAVATLIRADDPEFVFRAEWSVEDAVRAEICTIERGNIRHRTAQGRTGNWQKFPRQMMKARALGEVCRDAATDVLLGMHYLAEELEGAELDRNGEIVSTGPVPTTVVSTPDVDARPVSDHATDPPPDVDTPDPAGPITRNTQGTMMGLFRKAGIGGRSDADRTARRRVSEIILGEPLLNADGHPVALTEGDGLIISESLRVAGDNVTAYVENLLIGGEPDTTDDPTDDVTGGPDPDVDPDNPRE